MLDSQTIADIYTLAEIEAEIAIIFATYNQAIKNRMYQLDDMHSRQRIEQHDIDKIADQLNVWLRAKAIKTGVSMTKLITMTYTGGHN